MKEPVIINGYEAEERDGYYYWEEVDEHTGCTVYRSVPVSAMPTEEDIMSKLEIALEKWQVWEPGMWENELSDPRTNLIGDWWAVSNDDGIVAYFGREADAYRFRLAEVNRELNG